MKMDNKRPAKAEYEELVKDLKPDAVIGSFRVKRLHAPNRAILEIWVCTTKLQRNFEFMYMVDDVTDKVMEHWMNWSDFPTNTSTDGIFQQMTLEQMGKCIEHNKKWSSGSVFAGEITN
jgi:hypothetical protein